MYVLYVLYIYKYIPSITQRPTSTTLEHRTHLLERELQSNKALPNMPKAEVGSTKYISNKLKSKGLTRLRWYCQVCEKACRDENAFKMHTQSESHVRKMIIIGEDPRHYESQYSNEFLRDFIQLLKTAHRDKQVHMNRFYQEYISNKEHIHMNATRWSSLTEFAKHLGREGICRVEDVEGKGLHIAWIDNSPDALKRQEALRRKEAMDRGDEQREQAIIREQIQRARRDKEGSCAGQGEGSSEDEDDEKAEAKQLNRHDGQKITLSFGANNKDNTGDTMPGPAPTPQADHPTEWYASDSKPDPKPTISVKLGTIKPAPKNVFKQAKKAAFLSSPTTKKSQETPKKMTEAERIMREEIERKRLREAGGHFPAPNKKLKRI